LNVIGGFIRPTKGRVLIDGKEVSRPGAERGIVFQQHALFPWKTVRANVAFGPRMRGIDAEKRRKMVDHYLRLVGLRGFESRYAHELSGGMQQRVGLARCLANQPAVILMDEPFGSLDAQTRLTMQEELLRIWREQQCTIVFVTHDVEEGVMLADRIIVMTARPGTNKADILVHLDRPRSHDMFARPDYLEYKQRAHSLIREESIAAMWLNRGSVERESHHVALGVIDTVAEAGPLRIAERLKYFEQSELEVSLQSFDNGRIVSKIVDGGGLDGGAIGPIAFLQALQAGQRLRVCYVGGLPTMTDNPYFALCTAKGSPVISMADLPGKTIGVIGHETLGDVLLRLAAQEAGIPNSFNVIALPFQSMVPALREGRITAAVLFDPHLANSLAKGQVQIVREFQKYLPEFPLAVFFFSEQYVAHHEQNIGKLFELYQLAQKYMVENPEESKHIIAQQWDIESDTLKYMSLPHWESKSNISSLDCLQEALIEKGLIKNTVDIEAAVYTPSKPDDEL
jgi:NitT/TauT family transport system ATP-binding protein